VYNESINTVYFSTDMVAYRVKSAPFQHFLLLTNILSVLGCQTGLNCWQFSLQIFSIQYRICMPTRICVIWHKKRVANFCGKPKKPGFWHVIGSGMNRIFLIKCYMSSKKIVWN